MTYTLEQLEAIATTILNYEGGQTVGAYRAAHNELPITASEILMTGIPHRDLTWSLNLKLGANPAALQGGHSFTWQHPLHFMAAFEDYPELRDSFKERLHKNLTDECSDHMNLISAAVRKVPGPKDWSLRLDDACGQLFHPSHAAWYTPKALNKLAHEQMVYRYHKDISVWLGEVRKTLEDAKQDTSIFTSIATEVVIRALREKASLNTDYTSLARVIPLGDQERLEEELSPLNNVYAILCVALTNPSPKTMTRGLRAIASSGKYGLLRNLGRSPTLEELIGSNVKGAGHIWWRMPWSVLRPVVVEHGPTLRGALIKRTELPHEMLKEVLVDHEKRVRLLHETPVENDDEELEVWPDKADGISWHDWKRGLMRFFDAERLREVLSSEYSESVARLIVLRHLSAREDLARYVDPVLTETARAALATYDTPIVPSRFRKATGEPSTYEEVH